MELSKFLIVSSASMREALLKIEGNQHGFILSTDHSDSVIGLATDGDIRRKLLEGASLDDPIEACANTLEAARAASRACDDSSNISA